MMNPEPFPILYILMRNDLASMNPGKAMAQVSHASNAFIWDIKDKKAKLCDENYESGLEIFRNQIGLADIWENETSQGFGTVIVLEVNEVQMRTAVDVANKVGLVSGIINDPTYPLIDGAIVHYLALDTCAYVFGDKNEPMIGAVVGRFPLHP